MAIASSSATEPARAVREGTDAFHRQAVERAVLAIERRFSEEGLGLSAIAAEAISSPFHFARVFRRICGVPPCHFLTAVRMQAAKRLLVDTGLSVTNVCLEVGYSSLGTFTRRFTELVGFSPRAFRQIARRSPVSGDAAVDTRRVAASNGSAVVAGEVRGAVGGPIAIGLFPTALPQGRPVACCLIAQPGPYRIAGVPDGLYFVLAAALGGWRSISQEPEFRGAAHEPISVSGAERAVFEVDIQLRPRLITDPPILVSLPVLAVGAVGARARARLSARSESKLRRQFSQVCERRTAADSGRFSNRS